ncbi:MAG: sulfurtransferase [Elainellaceae cyanobacterium]
MPDLSLQLQSPLVSADWLHARLGQPDLVIVDCRFTLMQPEAGQVAYEAGHIPGAVYVHLNRHLSSPIQSTRRGGRHPLPNINSVVQAMEARGIGNHTTVIAYDDSRFAFASRLWWLLRYLGHDRVAVLDGGFDGWKGGGYAIETEVPSPQRQIFTPNIRADWVVDKAGVEARQSLETAALVDSRSGDRYRGDQEPIDPVAGHIPGAVNHFWQEVTNEQGYGRPPQEQRARWQDVADAEEIVVYCGSGVTACVNLLSLELAGLGAGKLYAGSWSDWCSYSGAAVERRRGDLGGTDNDTSG